MLITPFLFPLVKLYPPISLPAYEYPFFFSFAGFSSTSPVNISPQDSVLSLLLFFFLIFWVKASAPRNHLYAVHIQVSPSLSPTPTISTCMSKQKGEISFFSSRFPQLNGAIILTSRQGQVPVSEQLSNLALSPRPPPARQATCLKCCHGSLLTPAPGLHPLIHPPQGKTESSFKK